MSDYGWLREKLKHMISVAEHFKSICPNVYYDTGAWSAIKLQIILNYVPVYTRIIPKYFQSMRYIELLAGTGLCRIRETRDIIAGSTLIAATFCYNPFDEYILVEKSEQSAEALERRMEVMTPKVKVLRQDCNNCIDEILDELPEKSHYLAFVDCEGMDVDWSTMDKLLRKRGDLLFTFQSSQIARVRGNALKGRVGDENKLNKFFGDNGWRECEGADALLQHYMSHIRSRRDIVLSISVKGPRVFRYDVIYATRRTRADSPWLVAVTGLKRRTEKCDYRWVEGILDVLTGRQLRIEDIA